MNIQGIAKKFSPKNSHVGEIKKNQEIREQLYKSRENIIKKTPKKDVMIMARDFNTKTGYEWEDFKRNKQERRLCHI